MNQPNRIDLHEVAEVLGVEVMGTLYRATDSVVDSDPGAARVTIDGFPPPVTLVQAGIAVGEHEFRFCWSSSDPERVIRACIEHEGQRVSATPPQEQ